MQTDVRVCCVLCCFTAGHCSGTANITLPPSTLPSFVHLNLTCNVVSIQPGAVLEVFERAIMAFSRPTDPDHETGDQQVCTTTTVVMYSCWTVTLKPVSACTLLLGACVRWVMPHVFPTGAPQSCTCAPAVLQPVSTPASLFIVFMLPVLPLNTIIQYFRQAGQDHAVQVDH
jgi:hypothetical protein